MRRLREGVRTRRLAVAAIGLASAVGLGASTAGGSEPAGPGLDGALDGLEDVLAGPPGPDAGDCPRVLERLGVCESHDHEDPHEDDPQHDFQPYDGGDGLRSEHGHAHGHTGQPAARGGGGDHATGRTRGLTTLEQTIAGTGDPADGFQALRLAGGEARVVREELAEAEPGRAKRRRSLLYLGQTTDWQLADEESPARVELADITANPPFPNALSAAWRPQEALGAFAIEQSVRQLNEFADASPVPARRGARAAMDMVLMTGDQADNQQLNETDWVVRLLEGGPIDPNSGTDPQSCPPLLRPSGQTADPRLYAGVQDFDDYLEGQQFYDPDEPSGPKYSDWPAYPGLMDRAQVPFVAEGLDVPSYVVLGNHDALAQGNQKAILPFELVGTGCIKAMVPVTDLTEIADVLDPTYLLGLVTSDPEQVMLVANDSSGQ